MRAMILSAGLGTRLRPLTDKTAKPAIPFLGLPLLAYSLYYLEQCFITDLVVNTHYLPQTVEEPLLKLTKNKPYETHVLNEEKILGSGGGIKNAESHLKGDGDFVVCNADTVILFEHFGGLQNILEFHRASDNLVTHLTCHHEGLGKSVSAIWTDNDHKVVGYGKEPPRNNLHPEHFVGVHVFSERIFEYLPEGESNILLDGVQKAIAAGENVYSFYDPDIIWFETGNIEDLKAAEADCEKILSDSNPYAENLRNIKNYFKKAILS